MRDPFYYRMTDYDRSLLPNRHLASLDDGITGPDDWEGRSGYSAGNPAWGLIYYLAPCAISRGRRNDIVETGTNQGASTIVLAQALADAQVEGHVHSVEIDPENYATAAVNIAAAGHSERVDLTRGDSKEELPTILEGLDRLSVAFLDGSHLHDDVIAEFDLVYPRLSDTAIVLFDNTYRIAEDHEDPRVNGALHSILDGWGGHLVNLPFCSWYILGLAIWQQRPLQTTEPPPNGSAG